MWDRYTNSALTNDERAKFAYLYYLTRASVTALENAGNNDNDWIDTTNNNSNSCDEICMN